MSALMAAQPATAFDWGDTEIVYLYGTKFQEPFNPNDVTKNIITLQLASGYKYGSNFFFCDLLRSDGADNNAGEVYCEWYTHLSLSAISGKKVGVGFIKDVTLTAGINYGAKNTGANPRIFLPGASLILDVPSFAFFNVDVLAYIDHGNFKPDSATTLPACGGYKTTYQITPAWKLPFNIGPTKWVFEGFADFIGSHGTCDSQFLTQPQLRLDVGNFFGKPDTFYVGIEYQYWHNKFGFSGLTDNFPQFMVAWKL